MPSRPLPLSAHAGRSYRRGALSTSASSLPPGAFVLVPPLHDDRPQISAPMIATPNSFPTVQHAVSGFSSRRPVQPCPDPRRRLIPPHLEHAAGRLGTTADAPPHRERARERCIREIEGDRVVEHAPLSSSSHRRSRPRRLGNRCNPRYSSMRWSEKEDIARGAPDETNSRNSARGYR